MNQLYERGGLRLIQRIVKNTFSLLVALFRVHYIAVHVKHRISLAPVRLQKEWLWIPIAGPESSPYDQSARKMNSRQSKQSISVLLLMRSCYK